MRPDWVSNPGPLTYESGALPCLMYTFKSGTLKLIVHPKLNHILNLKLNLNLKIT